MKKTPHKNFSSIRKFAVVGLCLTILTFFSCKKMLETNAPYTSVNFDNVYDNEATATAVLTGLYSKMSQGSATEANTLGLSFLLGLSSDELTLYNSVPNISYIAYYKNQLKSTEILNFWNTFYSLIYSCNDAIEGLEKSKLTNVKTKDQLIGEAKFVRAFCYYYLLNLYGEVPLALTTDFQVNSKLSRAEKEDVWGRIISDLSDARLLLSNNFLDASLHPYPSGVEERIRPSHWAATALLARVYLFKGDYANAEVMSSEVIDNNMLFEMTEPANTFIMNSREAIWQLQPVIPTKYTWDANLFILSQGLNALQPVYLDTTLVNLYEVDDKRRSNWINSYNDASGTYYYAFKYKVNMPSNSFSEYHMVLRLAEQYLIRAEARAMQDNIGGALSDLNIIRARAGISNSSASDRQSLLTAILQERRLELFTEWGHRWLDLKRTDKIDEIMSIATPAKGNSTWQSFQKLYPIPSIELQNAPQLRQNSGY